MCVHTDLLVCTYIYICTYSFSTIPSSSPFRSGDRSGMSGSSLGFAPDARGDSPTADECPVSKKKGDVSMKNGLETRQKLRDF